MRIALASLMVLAPACATPPASPASDAPPHYAIAIDSSRAAAEVRLTLARSPEALTPARDGDGSGISDVRCADGRVLVREATRWLAPANCRDFRWRVALDPLDGRGLDASIPAAAFSRRHLYWVLPERDSLLRASDDGGTAAISLRLPDGNVVERRYLFPSSQQPPFYAVVGAAPTVSYAHDGFELRVFGAPPDFAWMDSIHRDVIEAWARWRRDLVAGSSPVRIDWAWVEPTADLEPGYAASAGAEAIISQIRLPEGDPDAEAKARAIIATSAAHEGFHSLTGAPGQAWPAWVNESLASHFAIEAVRRFLPPADFRFVEHFFIEPEHSGPLLVAQSAHVAGDGDPAQLFYLHGARFWREIETVLEVPPNGSGRLAALILGSRNFTGVDLQNAGSVAAFLDRHSGGRAGPIVRCYLEGLGCPGCSLASP